MTRVVAFVFSGDSLLSGEFILEPGLNVVYGLNGAGKTRLLRGVRSSLLGIASDVGGGIIVRLGSGGKALHPWVYDVRSVEHALAAALASEDEYLPEGLQFLGRALPRERSVPDDRVFEVIDRVIAEAAGDEESLITELIQNRYFLLMPTGAEADPSWDAWPVADVTLNEASAALGAVREHERDFDELDEDAAADDADEALYEYIDELREFAFFAHSETAIRSRGPRAWFSPTKDDRFHPYWHGTPSAADVAGTSVSGPLDFEHDMIDTRTSVEAATKSHFAQLAKAHSARFDIHALFDEGAEQPELRAGEHIEPLLADAADELSQSVTRAIREVLLDGPTAKLYVRDALQRFANEPVMWHFSRTNSSHELTLDELSRAEKSWAEQIIIEELYWHRRNSPLLNAPRDSDTLRPVLTLLDEPEAALHRTAEAHMAKSLRRRASDSRRWILAATHSPELLDAPDARITEVARDFEGGFDSHIHTLSLGDKNALESLGLRPSDLLQLNRVYLLVEGLHDEVLLQHYYSSRLAEARVGVVPIRGATQLASTFDSQVLYSYTSAHVVVLLDNLRGELLREVWAKAEAAALEGETQEAVKLLLDGIPTKDAKGKRLDEAQFIVDWLRQGIEQGRAGRLTPEGLERADVIEYLPIDRVISGYASWDELRTEHQTERQASKDIPADFKRWLEIRKKLSFDADSLREYAADKPPAEFERLMKTLEAISANVASSDVP